MGLREIAAQDLAAIVQDVDTGFGWPIVLTNPQGVSRNFTGYSSDISVMINPETGQAISGRHAHVGLIMASLIAENFGMPTGVPDSNRKPWLVAFNDIAGQSHTFKVYDVNPDRAIGFYVLILEAYKP